MWNRKRSLLLIICIGLVSLYLSLWIPFPQERLAPKEILSLRILDREGRELCEVRSAQDGCCRWLEFEEVPQNMINALVGLEDKRFWNHPGVDLRAILRAILQNIRSRRIVSGGSTITQQVVRQIFGIRRTFVNKLYETWLALRLENTLSKEEIFTQYINRVPFANGAYGLEAASQLYFGKPASSLSLAESAWLAGIPGAPSKYDPYRFPQSVRRRKDFVLQRMLDLGYISEAEYRMASSEEVRPISARRNFRAPHFTRYCLSQLSPQERERGGELWTTLDLRVQEATEKLLRDQIDLLRSNGVTNGAAVVIENPTGEILAMVGSKDFFDPSIQGQVNGVLSLRQPGSAVKPFTYGLALSSGMTPATLLPDIEAYLPDFGGDYSPHNYDNHYHGPVRLRIALASSYNVPAARVAYWLGVDRLLSLFRRVGMESLRRGPYHYGLGLTLGDGEVTLLELAHAYSALACGGKLFRLKWRMDDLASDEGKVVFSPQVAWLLADILSDRNARIPAFGENTPLNLPFSCAAKTGTSKDYRDNWTLGYTTKYTVGVWVGNFDGRPMERVSGITGAGPIFRDLMLYLHRDHPPGKPPTPPGIIRCSICPLSGLLPGPDCPTSCMESFIKGTEPKRMCGMHRRIRIDRRNGLLASEDTPEEFVEKRLYTVLGPLYRDWAHSQGIPDPPEEFSPLGQSPKFVSRPNQLGGDLHPFAHWPGDTMLQVSFPSDGDIFQIDPILRREYQTIKLSALVPQGIPQVTWWVDGERFCQVGPPFSARWRIEEGRHKIWVSAPGRRSQAIRIEVLQAHNEKEELASGRSGH